MHLEGFFSKAASTKLLLSRPRHNIVLKLKKPLKGRLPSYRILLVYLPLEKEITDKLFQIGFIEYSIDKYMALILFIPKLYFIDRCFYINYR